MWGASVTPEPEKGHAGSKEEGVSPASAPEPSWLSARFPQPHGHVGGRTREKEGQPLSPQGNWPWAPAGTVSMGPGVEEGAGAQPELLEEGAGCAFLECAIVNLSNLYWWHSSSNF